MSPATMYAGIRYRNWTKRFGKPAFTIEFSSPYIAATYPLVWLTPQFQRELPVQMMKASVQNKAEDELKIIPVVNEIFRGILSLEAGWLVSEEEQLPFGSSLVMLARKPIIS